MSDRPAKLSFAKRPRTDWGISSHPMRPIDAPRSIPAPSVDLTEIGVDRWHYDLWHRIISAALDGHPDQVDLSYHQGLRRPAVSRYGATTPKLLGWFQQLNRGREYGDQVKPFNFLIALQARPDFVSTDGEMYRPNGDGPESPLSSGRLRPSIAISAKPPGWPSIARPGRGSSPTH